MNKPLSVSQPVYDRLTDRKARLRAELNRRVSYTEVLERLLQDSERLRELEAAGRRD